MEWWIIPIYNVVVDFFDVVFMVKKIPPLAVWSTKGESYEKKEELFTR